MYMYAWEMGLKTTYYLRTLGASSIEQATTNIKSGAVGQQTNSSNDVSINDLSHVQSPVPSPIQHSPAPVAVAVPVMDDVKREVASQGAVNTEVGESVIMVNGKQVKISKILDPNCEACQ
jgi:ribonucleotide reductase alpha subunit